MKFVSVLSTQPPEGHQHLQPKWSNLPSSCCCRRCVSFSEERRVSTLKDLVGAAKKQAGGCCLLLQLVDVHLPATWRSPPDPWKGHRTAAPTVHKTLWSCLGLCVATHSQRTTRPRNAEAEVTCGCLVFCANTPTPRQRRSSACLVITCGNAWCALLFNHWNFRVTCWDHCVFEDAGFWNM